MRDMKWSQVPKRWSKVPASVMMEHRRMGEEMLLDPTLGIGYRLMLWWGAEPSVFELALGSRKDPLYDAIQRVTKQQSCAHTLSRGESVGEEKYGLTHEQLVEAVEVMRGSGKVSVTLTRAEWSSVRGPESVMQKIKEEVNR